MDDTQDKRLFLIDAFAMIFRGYYALIKNPRLTSKGLNTSAIFGFTNSLIELIKREKPSHLAVVFDVGGKTFRHEEFQAYKANRAETPEPIQVAIPYIHRILEAMHIPILGVEGFEADDVIGTLSYRAEKEGYNVFMVTPDKDFAQLVTKNIKIYKPAARGADVEILGIEEVKEKYEIDDPKQIIDFLAMMGDSVDNIPGLEGVGEKTAKKLLKTYGSIENLLANTSDLKGKQKEKIEASADKGILSKKLATIFTDVPIVFHQNECNLEKPDFEKVKNIFEELEFRRLYENVYKAFSSDFEQQNQKESAPTSNEKKILKPEQLDIFSQFEYEDESENSEYLFQYVNTEKAVSILVKNILEKSVFAFEIISNLSNELDFKIFGISVSYKESLAYYVPISDKNKENVLFLEILKPLFENRNQVKISHNLKNKYKILNKLGINFNGNFFDTSIAHYLLNPDSKHDIEHLSNVYFGYKSQYSDVFNKKLKKTNPFEDINLEEQTIFACEIVNNTYKLYGKLASELKSDGMENLFTSVEMPLVKVLADMERIGISLNKDLLLNESKELEKDLKELEMKIFNLSGETFNMNSPKQLGEILFEKLKLNSKAKKTSTGQYATSEDILQKISSKHEIIQYILQYRQLQKLKSTYVDALPLQIHPSDERIHTTFSQITTSTGRLSSLSPNLQNIPIRTLRGQQIRAAFVAEKGKKIISADYSQIELRLIAEISEENNMLESFDKGIDIHTSTAVNLFKISIDKVSKLQRNQAKTVNFGIIYGQSAFALAEQTGLSRSEAKIMIDTYYSTYPKLREYMNKQVEKARSLGYVETILGRKRRLIDINSANFVVRGHAERNAVNTPIQGSAADVIKLAMINIFKKFEEQNLETKMLLQVHDELVFEAPINEVNLVTELIKTEMENAISTKVPLIVEIGVGDNWLEAH